MKNTMKEFKEFIAQGNVMDMAVGVIIGGAFGKIVTSLVNDIFMPLIGLLLGGVDFTNLFYALDGNKYANLKEAQAATGVLAYGNFIQNIVDFLIIALVIFLFLKNMAALSSKLQKKEEAVEEATTKVCPFCKTEIDLHASRCPHCTSQLDLNEAQ